MKKLAFGTSKIPQIKNKINNINLTKMVDTFIENEYSFFDVSNTNKKPQIQQAIKEVLTSRYNQAEYQIADKLPIMNIKENQQLEEIFQQQLKHIGCEYFNYYQIPDLYDITNPTETLDIKKFIDHKKEHSKIKNLIISTHMGHEYLDKLLTDTGDRIEYVQLQLNYLDFTNKILQSEKCYQVACKHKKPVIITEPLKNGLLTCIPERASKLIKDEIGDDPVTWAFRFLISIPNVAYIISDMNNLKQLKENIEIFNNIKPLTKKQLKLNDEIIKIINQNSMNRPLGCNLQCGSCTLNCPSARRG